MKKLTDISLEKNGYFSKDKNNTCNTVACDILQCLGMKYFLKACILTSLPCQYYSKYN